MADASDRTAADRREHGRKRSAVRIRPQQRGERRESRDFPRAAARRTSFDALCEDYTQTVLGEARESTRAARTEQLKWWVRGCWMSMNSLALFEMFVRQLDWIQRFLECNPPMSLPRDGFSRSVQSLDIRLVVDTLAVFTWSAHANDALEFVNQRSNRYWPYVCAISAIVLPERRSEA